MHCVIIVITDFTGDTATAAPPPFKLGDPALCGSHHLVTPYHRLRGSASSVLTATHHFYGSPKLSDFFSGSPPEIRPPQPILTQNGSNDVDSRKDDTFAVKSQLFIPPDPQGR